MRGLISAHHLDGDVQRTARKNVLRGSRIFLVFLFCCRRLLSFLLCMFSFFSCFSNWRSAFESARVRFRVWYRMHSARQTRTRRRQKKKKSHLSSTLSDAAIDKHKEETRDGYRVRRTESDAQPFHFRLNVLAPRSSRAPIAVITDREFFKPVSIFNSSPVDQVC